MDIIRAMLYLIISLNSNHSNFHSCNIMKKKPTLYVYINQDAFNLLINQEIRLKERIMKAIKYIDYS
jgi:lipid A disaccharide synthetase